MSLRMEDVGLRIYKKLSNEQIMKKLASRLSGFSGISRNSGHHDPRLGGFGMVYMADLVYVFHACQKIIKIN